MAISRRTLLARLSAGAAAAVAAPRRAAGSSRATPGATPPDAVAPRQPLRLNRNENAYGPSAVVLTAMREAALGAAFRYPDVEAEALRRAIAGHHGVPPAQVVLGCGSGEILRAAIAACVGPQKTLVAATPTFERVAEWAQQAGARVVGVPLTREYSHDLRAMLAQTTPETGLVYVCNPNSPTGGLTRREELEAFVRAVPAPTAVLIDEAYHHYAGDALDYASFIDRPAENDRVIVTRSFSKIHGLAGVRVGYAIAAPPMARLLAPRLLPGGVSVVAARAAAAALDDREHLRASLIRTTDDKQEFFNQALSRMLRPIDSVTNFVMFNTGRPAGEVAEHFRQHGVLVFGPIPAFDTAIRVSLGTPVEMREFWRVWDLMAGHVMAH